MSETREEKITNLHQVFGNDELSKTLIGAVLDANNGDVSATAESLMEMSKDTTGRKPVEPQLQAPRLVVRLQPRAPLSLFFLEFHLYL